MTKQKKRRKRALAPIVFTRGTLAVLRWHDIRDRSKDEIWGSKRVWRIASGLTTGGSVAYWIAGRRHPIRLG